MDTLLTLILGAGGGGAAWKIWDKYTSHKKLTINTEVNYREELKQDIDKLREYVSMLEKNNIENKQKYIELFRDYNNLLIEFKQLKLDFEKAKEEIKTLRKTKEDK